MSEIMFEKFDKDGSGSIDKNEFQLLCRNLGYALSSSELDFAMKEIDLDGNQTIQKGEFAKWWGKADRWESLHLDEKQLETRKAAADTFSAFDANNKGIVGKSDFELFYKELKRQKLTTKEKDACLKDLDTNNDGAISFSEYVEWLARVGSIDVKVIKHEGRQKMGAAMVQAVSQRNDKKVAAAVSKEAAAKKK